MESLQIQTSYEEEKQAAPHYNYTVIITHLPQDRFLQQKRYFTEHKGAFGAAYAQQLLWH